MLGRRALLKWIVALPRIVSPAAAPVLAEGPRAPPSLVAEDRDSVPDVRDWWQVKGDGANDDSSALARAARESLALSFPPNRKYIVDGVLSARSGAMWYGPGLAGNSVTAEPVAAPKLYFTGRGQACISNADPTTPLSHFGMAGIIIQADGEYDWMMDFRHPVGNRLRDMRLQTTRPSTGGIHSQKLSPGGSWVNNWTQVEVRLPRESSTRPLDIDFSDSAILGGSFSGGLGTAIRGTGAVKLIGTRLDITNAKGAGITIFKQHESTGYHALIGCQIEENLGYGVLVDGDADELLIDPHVLTLIDACQFRNHGGARADICLKNNTGKVLRGPRIQGNVHTLPEHPLYVMKHVDYDPDRWSEDPVIYGAYRDKPQATLYVAGQERQPRLDLAHWNGTAGSEGRDFGIDLILRTEMIRGYTLGPNDGLIVEADWECEGEAEKNLRVSLGDAHFMSLAVETATFVRTRTIIRNQGSRQSQRGAPADHSGFGASSGAPVSAAQDTARDQPLSFSCRLTAPGARVVLRAYVISLLKG